MEMNGMLVEEIKNRNRDGIIHYRMSTKKGDTEFSVNDENKEMIAYMWDCIGEGRRFLKELENFAHNMELKLIINNVINPKLETILRKEGYKDFYIKDPFIDDWMQYWKKEPILCLDNNKKKFEKKEE